MDLEYYEILEITKDANSGAIKKAYRTQALKFHPDRNRGDKNAEEQFKLINEAYQVLSDSKKRSTYDRYGKKGLDSQGFSNFSDMDYTDIMGDLGGIFESAFGGGFHSSQKHQRKYSLDAEIEINIAFNEAIFGCNKEVKYSYKKPCKDCNGTGSSSGKKSTCSQCNGKGQVFYRQGFMTYSQTCPHCNGKGTIVKNPCSTCSAKGYSEQSDTMKIDIPEGIDSGNRIRVAKRGNIDDNGEQGDLYIQINAGEDEHFQRHNDDIYIEVPLFFTQVALGEEITLPTLRGEVKLELPMGAKDKQQFVFKKKGVKNVHTGELGSMVAQIKIKYPKKLSASQREILTKLQDDFGIESNPHESTFEGTVEKIKGWFK
ncbi:MAG: molecular chaperone DnaJ [Sulfurospirillum sp.]|nr:molecular chaperone DnaJ [Sulfurospirillum sp.]MBL0702686.1 molecular chaperone DnaJ [Sulfurospirillum sp.]